MTFRRGTRLITGISGSRIEDVVAVVTALPMAADFVDPVAGPQALMRDIAHSDKIDRERATLAGPYSLTTAGS